MKLQTYILCSAFILLGCRTLLASAAKTEELNAWPVWVGQASEEAVQPDDVESWSAAGPLIFWEKCPSPEAPNTVATGFRPLFVEKKDPARDKVDHYFLYPLFSLHSDRFGQHWSLLSLINHYETTPTSNNLSTAGKSEPAGFDLWPFYFSRDTGNPATSYQAVMPFYGDIKNRFGMDRLSWTLFPLYAQAEKRNVRTTAVLWPFFRTIEGEGNHGFTFWPLFGQREKTGAYREQFYLWPLIYRDEHDLWQQKPRVRQGFLPFYASETSVSVKSETYVWPFFGYTDRTQPRQYHEIRYFWPFFVQGRGDNIYVNRWGPFYTHSIRKGIDKTWVLWPIWRHQQWTESGLNQDRKQVLWFVFNSTVQKSASKPSLPAAHKTHLWPLVSIWDNGAGQKQIQALSLFSTLFPYNEPIRLTYDPLFAVYRYDQSSPSDRKHTFLWNLVSWKKAEDQREFHFGPVFGYFKSRETGRWAIGCGLFGFKRDAADLHWKPFLFDFKRKTATAVTPQP